MNQTFGPFQRHWVGKIQYDRVWGSRGSRNLMKYTTGLKICRSGKKVIEWFRHRRQLGLQEKRWTCKLNNVDYVCRGSYAWMGMLGDRPTLVSSHDMLQGVHTDRASQNFVVCPSYLMLQVCQPWISLHIIHSSQFKSALPLVLVSQRHIPHAGLSAYLKSF